MPDFEEIVFPPNEVLLSPADFFAGVLPRFRDYATSPKLGPEWRKNPLNQGLLHAASARIEKVRYLLRDLAKAEIKAIHLSSTVRPLLDALARGDRPKMPVISSEFLDSLRELDFYNEAFYHFSWTLVETIQKLPGFKKFKPAGVRMVRNNLLAHPEKVKFSGNIAFELPTVPLMDGPRLRANEQYDGPLDPGVYVNAVELRTDMLEKIESFLSTGKAVG